MTDPVAFGGDPADIWVQLMAMLGHDRFATHDSPVGLAAWTIDNRRTRCDCA